MSNRNHNLNNNGTDSKATEKKSLRDRLPKIGWKKALKVAGNVACGVCAAFGAAGLVSYGVDQFKKPGSAPDHQVDVKLTDI